MVPFPRIHYSFPQRRIPIFLPVLHHYNVQLPFHDFHFAEIGMQLDSAQDKNTDRI